MGKAQNDYKARHKKQLLCPNDSRQAVRGIHCLHCAEKNRERVNRLMPETKKQRIKEGRCRSCGAPKISGTQCPNCQRHLYRSNLCNL